MLSKTQSKYIRSLALLKFRKESQCFIAEGEKIAGEWLKSAEKIQWIIGLQDWIHNNRNLIAKHPEANVVVVDEDELKNISTLKTPNKALLVVADQEKSDPAKINSWCIALDGIRDPGNMGTILRIADWYGIQHVVCSTDCVDPYSPKVVQAGMGAHLRVKIYEEDLEKFIKGNPMPSIAAVLGGTNIYDFRKIDKGILMIGNEGKGISESLIKTAKFSVTIPRIGGAESLNAGVSTGILCALLLGK